MSTEPTISLYGECMEGDDPSIHEQAIKDGAIWLANNGHRTLARDLLEELAVAVSLDLTPLSSARAKREDKWDALIEELTRCARLIRELPFAWRDPIIEEFIRLCKKGTPDG